MTVQELVIAFYQKVGEPTDLSPYTYVAEVGMYDTAAVGWLKCVDYLNRAYKLLASWKTPGGRSVKFREMYQTIMWYNTDIVTINTAAVSSAPTVKPCVIAFAGEAWTVNALAGWYVNINGFTSIVISNTVDTITVRDEPGTVVVNGFTATFYKRWFPIVETAADVANLGAPYTSGQYILPVSGRKMISIQRIVNLTLNNFEIVPADRTMLFWDYPAVRTHPMLYRFTNFGLELESAPVNGDLLRIMYYGEPEELTENLQVPNIPSVWHELIWMIAAWMRKVADQNSEEAAFDERRINFIIESRVQEHERDMDEMNVGFYVY